MRGVSPDRKQGGQRMVAGYDFKLIDTGTGYHLTTGIKLALGTVQCRVDVHGLLAHPSRPLHHMLYRQLP